LISKGNSYNGGKIIGLNNGVKTTFNEVGTIVTNSGRKDVPEKYFLDKYGKLL